MSTSGVVVDGDPSFPAGPDPLRRGTQLPLCISLMGQRLASPLFEFEADFLDFFLV